jgi:hypothetical protein
MRTIVHGPRPAARAVSTIDADVVAEGRRLLERAAAEGVPLRLLGGVAIRLRARGAIPLVLERQCQDLDFVTLRSGGSRVTALLRTEGYEPHVAFNALHANERMLFFDDQNERQIDVFVGSFRMCHSVPLEGRIELEPDTLPLAELLLTKLQIAELNEKDVKDALVLLHDHPLGSGDGDSVNADRIARLCADNWGLWRTLVENLTACRAFVEVFQLEPEAREVLEGRVDALLDRIDVEPKSRAWRLRAKIGDRKRWYETPEEVGEA